MEMNKKNDSGIALLFTLGILSLLLVLALSFATTTSIERKAASVNNDLTSAKLLADSAYERVLGGLSWYFDSSVNSGAKDIQAGETCLASKTSTTLNSNATNNSGQSYDTLEDALDSTGVYEYEWPASYNANSNVNHPAWDYVVNADEILGRVAYVVIPTGGKLTPEVCSNTTQSRPGVSPSEINITNA